MTESHKNFDTVYPLQESALTGDPIVLLGDFNTYVGNDIDTWRAVIARTGFPERGQEAQSHRSNLESSR